VFGEILAENGGFSGEIRLVLSAEAVMFALS
jgi:hypothetical protein